MFLCWLISSRWRKFSSPAHKLGRPLSTMILNILSSIQLFQNSGNKATTAFWKFCADVARWQDNRGCFVTIIYPRGEGFWSSQGCRSLARKNSFHSETFSFTKDPKVKSLTLKSNLPEGTFGRLHSLDRFSGDGMALDPKVVILMTCCLKDECMSDHR